VLGAFLWAFTHQHPGPMFNIGNGFDQPVIVYFEGQKMGKIDAKKNKIFYPYEVLNETNTDLLLELKSTPGTLLYSRYFTHEDLWAELESVTGRPYWIGLNN
jgi:hypothetical protein